MTRCIAADRGNTRSAAIGFMRPSPAWMISAVCAFDDRHPGGFAKRIADGGPSCCLNGCPIRLHGRVSRRWWRWRSSSGSTTWQLLMGVLFGVLGLALAMPMAALGLTLVREVYVQRYLGKEARVDNASVQST